MNVKNAQHCKSVYGKRHMEKAFNNYLLLNYLHKLIRELQLI